MKRSSNTVSGLVEQHQETPEYGRTGHSYQAGVVKAALAAAGGSAAGVGAILLAAGNGSIDAGTARFGVATFALIMLVAFGIAAIYSLRRS